jgi:hypothetical protein
MISEQAMGAPYRLLDLCRIYKQATLNYTRAKTAYVINECMLGYDNLARRTGQGQASDQDLQLRLVANNLLVVVAPGLHSYLSGKHYIYVIRNRCNAACRHYGRLASINSFDLWAWHWFWVNNSFPVRDRGGSQVTRHNFLITCSAFWAMSRPRALYGQGVGAFNIVQTTLPVID